MPCTRNRSLAAIRERAAASFAGRLRDRVRGAAQELRCPAVAGHFSSRSAQLMFQLHPKQEVAFYPTATRLLYGSTVDGGKPVSGEREPRGGNDPFAGPN